MSRIILGLENVRPRKMLGPEKWRVPKKFWSWKILGPKNCWVPKIVGPQKLLGPKNFGSWKNLGPKYSYSWIPKNFWSWKFFGPDFFRSQKKFWSQKFLWSHKILVPKLVLVPKSFWPEKFWSKVALGFFSPEKCWVLKMLGLKNFKSQKLWVSKVFVSYLGVLSAKIVS